MTTYSFDAKGGVMRMITDGVESVIDPSTNRYELSVATHRGSSPVPPEAQTIQISLVVKDGIVKQAGYDIENIAFIAARLCNEIRGMSIDEVKQWLTEQNPDAKASWKACAAALANALQDA